MGAGGDIPFILLRGAVCSAKCFRCQLNHRCNFDTAAKKHTHLSEPFSTAECDKTHIQHPRISENFRREDGGPGHPLSWEGDGVGAT